MRLSTASPWREKPDQPAQGLMKLGASVPGSQCARVARDLSRLRVQNTPNHRLFATIDSSGDEACQPIAREKRCTLTATARQPDSQTDSQTTMTAKQSQSASQGDAAGRGSAPISACHIARQARHGHAMQLEWSTWSLDISSPGTESEPAGLSARSVANGRLLCVLLLVSERGGYARP